MHEKRPLELAMAFGVRTRPRVALGHRNYHTQESIRLLVITAVYR